ncbi:MAG: L-seryl-tRNA(Sec) selenium transferase [Coriobacteriaceae bacterium]|nr:L-seryl-tRNA(Sec) selenium transferase [Coriobacteriaceae bacterium]MDY3799189.1 L-seryl-tRNA(Sec) selenium transferase [Eggerthellaceae bacterium]
MDKAALAPLLKRIPQVQEVLKCECISSLEESLPHSLLSDCVRSEITALRASILAGENPEFDTESVAQGARSRTLAFMAPSLRRIINATGVVIHTNMGRSVMCPQAIAAVEDVIKGYSTCEYDTNKMQRGSRHNHYERLICAITGAEAAIAVNNNAAAVVLVLSEFAAGHEAIVSRGELIELGGSFRIPDIMDQSGATMVEVGTTNKTHPHDYERAITENTSMMLKIHKSNYQVIGFTKNVSLTELRDISNAHEKETGHKVLVFEDQGSGSFVDLERYGARKEPTVAQSLAEGADLVSFSGDKMLGGPQCGIVVGRKELIDRLKKNPLARVVRLDKMTLAALEGTLRCYLQGEEAINSIPTVRMLSEDADTVRVRADKLKAMIEERIEPGKADIEVVPEISRAGGGSLPMYDIDTFAVAIKPVAGSTQECDKFLVQQCPVPIVARIAHDAVIVDPRTLLDEEEMEAVAEGLKNYFATV